MKVAENGIKSSADNNILAFGAEAEVAFGKAMSAGYKQNAQRVPNEILKHNGKYGVEIKVYDYTYRPTTYKVVSWNHKVKGKNLVQVKVNKSNVKTMVDPR